MDFTTTGLLADIRRRAMLPATTTTGTADADLLALANAELWLNVSADILAAREEYGATYTDTALSGTEYRIPYRAVAQSIRLASLRNSSGLTMNLNRVRPEQVEQWAGSGASSFGFYVRGGYLVLVPSVSSAFTTLRMDYIARPSELTATATDWGVVTTINTATGAVGFSGSGAFSTSANVDFVSSKPGFDVMAAEVTPTAVGAGTLTVAATSLPAGLAVGDYICVAAKAPVPTIPAEFHPILAIRTARTVCVALGDHAQAKVLDDQLEEAEENAGRVVLSPRTPGNPQKAVARTNALTGGRRYVP